MPLNAGELDREVRIEQAADGAGASRFPTETWSTLDTVWASKRDVSGGERFRAGQITAPFDSRWQIYYRADMDPDLVDVPKQRRLVYEGRIYQIVAAVQVEREAGIELMTLAGSKVA